MTEDDLKHIERTANALGSWGMTVQADMMRSLIAEVRRLSVTLNLVHSPYAAEVNVEQSTELAKALLRKHGGHQNSRPIMVLPKFESSTLVAPATAASKAEIITDLQRTPVEELVEFWDQRSGVMGIGCKFKQTMLPDIPGAAPYLAWHPGTTDPTNPNFLSYAIPLSACVKHFSPQGEHIGYRVMVRDLPDGCAIKDAEYSAVILPLSEVTASADATEPQHVVGG